ncbi:InlB B-repeat-containing protein [Brevibacillus ruminantium]|uniref:InlB B-repeat-containing protein n=1 Tax=Brevibacillus ruminantium TaxID=2950604 RepID=A0ABY4WK73_9BACL|nr:InlB B-repeat-containing protein [Brevibacillus ruminantium]USG66548.1 InlB B-repeat-containing protein [Brevibacillus ruminantium]
MKEKTRSFTRFLSMMLLTFLLLADTSGYGKWVKIVRAAESWESKETRTTDALNKVAHHGGTWLTVGNNGAIRKSTDEENWNIRGSLSITEHLNDVTNALDTWVTVGRFGALYFSTDDGDSWKTGDSGVSFDLRAITSSDDMFVAVGESGTILYSLDGQVWASTKLSNDMYFPPAILSDIAYGGGKFVAVGNDGYNDGEIYSSPDGRKWQKSSNVPGIPLGITYGDGKFIAVGNGGAILYSEDGVTWERQTSPTDSTVVLNGVTYEQGHFTAVGSSGTVIHSADGKIWEAETSGISTNLHHIAFANNKYIAVGEGGRLYVQNASVLTNAAAPNIDTQPMDHTGNVGDSVSLSIGATVNDGGTLSYQWYRNTISSNSGGTAINGATDATYIAPTGAAGTTYYYVVVTNTNSQATGSKIATTTSDVASVEVNALANAFTVTYNGNGATSGSVPIDSNEYEEGTTVTVLRNSGDLSKEDYTFAGWNTQADGGGTRYAPGDTFPMGTEDVTLYAMWTAKFAGGDGSAGSPFEIQTVDQLSRVRNALSASYKLIADIDLTEYLSDGGEGYNGGAGWVPIGTAGAPFTGTFDGNGKVITGLRINRPAADNQGLFGYTAHNAELQDVGFTGADVTGNNGVGALVGNNNGSITNSWVSGTVAGNFAVGGLAGYNYGSISNSSATTELTGNGQNVGGLVGENSSVIADSYSEGAVTGSSDVGGLVGKNNGTIQHSHATGVVTSTQYGAGGLVGYNNGGIISDTYATGPVKSQGIGDNVGGLIGANDYNGAISKSYATGTVEGNKHAGGLVGYNYGSILESNASGAVQAVDEVGGLAGRSNKASSIQLSFATGEVTGRYYVGGLVGMNEGYIGDAYATGSVTGDQVVGGLVGVHDSERIVDTYATGAVVANMTRSGVGGLVGINNSTVIESYYDKETTGQTDEGKGEGKRTDEMWQKSTYVGWNFSSIWSIREGINNGYPYFFRVYPFFTVLYDGNGSTSGNVPIDSNTYHKGASVTVLRNSGDLSKEDYTFAGWNTQADGDGTRYAPGDTFPMGTEDVTLYAMWREKQTPHPTPTYTVTYHDNGATSGNVPIDSNDYEEGTTVTVLRNSGDLSKEDYTFAGWNTQADGGGTRYAPGDTFPMGTEDVTLYAMWRAKQTPHPTPTYTVTYHDNGATSGNVPIDSNEYEEGTTVTVLRNSGDLSREDYTFAGWNTQADSGGTRYAPGDTFPMGTENVTLYAMWTANQTPNPTPTYTVTYHDNGATSGNVPIDSNEYEEGTTVTVLRNSGDLSREDYTFAGWNTQADGGGTRYAPGDTFPMGTDNVTLYAMWTANQTPNPTPTYTVTYNDNGATSGNVPIDSNEYEEGTTVKVLGNSGKLAKTDYTFAGWNTQVDGGGTRYAPGDTFTMGTEDVTLYAMWRAKQTPHPTPTYTVTYNDNGATSGNVPIDSNEYEEGTTVTVLRNSGDLSKEDYKFAGWNTQADGGGTRYAPGDTFPMGTENVTLYAMWTANQTPHPTPTYTVTYHDNGATSGNVPIDSNEYEEGTTVTVLRNSGDLSKEDYKFAGWNTQADGGGTRYAPGDTFPMGTENVTLYAMWTANQTPHPTPTYTVTYHDNGATSGNVPIDSNEYEEGTTVTVLRNSGDLSREDYTFAGWNTQADGGGTSYTPGDTFTMGTANVTLYAKWRAKQTPHPTPTYTVTYHDNGATSGNVPIDSNEYEEGTTVKVLGNSGKLAKTDYTFAGWNTQADGGGTSYAAGDTFTMGTANVTLYAKWKVNHTGGSSRDRSSREDSSDRGSSSKPPSDTVISTNGKLTLPVGKKGELSLGDEIKIVIPADAFDKELQLTINKVANTQNLFTSKDVLASPVFEIWKNVSEDFSNLITLTFTFDPKSLKDHQKPSVFYYDESKQVWVDIGGKVNGNTITVKVNHLGKFAVFAIDRDGDTKQPVNFSDLSGHWAKANIKQAVRMGFVSGYPDGTFNPNGPITRSEFTVMLAGALKLEGSSEALAFTDNDQIGAWAKQAVALAVKAGIVSGYEDGSFRPNARITRAEMAVMIARVLRFSLDENATTSFADDGEIPNWAKGTVEMVRKQRIASGRNSNNFVPNDTATRAEAVVMLLRMLEVRDQQ